MELIVGPMFSGKTGELQRRLRLSKIAGRNVIGFRYSRDNRYGEEMKTHDLMSFDAKSFSNIQDIFANKSILFVFHHYLIHFDHLIYKSIFFDYLEA